MAFLLQLSFKRLFLLPEAALQGRDLLFKIFNLARVNLFVFIVLHLLCSDLSKLLRELLVLLNRNFEGFPLDKELLEKLLHLCLHLRFLLRQLFAASLRLLVVLAQFNRYSRLLLIFLLKYLHQ